MGEATADWSAAFAGATLDGMKAYDDYVVPALFVPFTANVIERIAPRPGEIALDVATGTGIVARALAERVAPTGRVVACDISPAMLAVAGAKPHGPELAPIEYVETPAAPLKVDDDAFELATCQQGCQFFPDNAAALAEMRRALRDGGRLLVSVWDSIESCPAFAALQQAVTEVLGDEIGQRYLGPWSYRGEELAEQARAAGFTSVSLEHVALPCVYPGGPEGLVNTLPAAGIAQAYLDAGEEGRRALIETVSRTAAPLMVAGELRSHATSSVIVAS